MTLSLETLDSDVSAATVAIFEETPPYVGATEKGPRALVVRNAVKYVFDRSIDLSVPPQESPLLALFSADIIRRGLVDPEDLKMNGEYHDQLNLLIERINAAKPEVGNPTIAGELVPAIGNLAFNNVILRPDGLVVPSVERKLHTSDLGEFYDDPLAQAFRHRHNFIKGLMQHGEWSAAKQRALQGFITSDGVPDIDKFAHALRNHPEKLQKRTIETMTKIGVAQMAGVIIALDYAEQDVLRELKEEYIERGYAIIDRDANLQRFGESWIRVYIDEQGSRHVLAGDKNGGGHHLASLDNRFVTQIGPIETVKHVGKSGLMYEIPVSRVQKRNLSGLVTSDTVSSFFPAEWSAADVLDAISNPVRYMYGRDRNNGTTEDYVMSKGLLIKRIYTDDEERRLITAYPSIFLPPDVEKRLSGK